MMSDEKWMGGWDGRQPEQLCFSVAYALTSSQSENPALLGKRYRSHTCSVLTCSQHLCSCEHRFARHHHHYREYRRPLASAL